MRWSIDGPEGSSELTYSFFNEQLTNPKTGMELFEWIGAGMELIEWIGAG